MAEYIPQMPFCVPLFLLQPSYEIQKGVTVKTYPKPEEGQLFYCSFRTFGGTESLSNNMIVVLDTAVIETWYREDIKSDCRFATAQGHIYDVVGTPENRHEKSIFKMQNTACQRRGITWQKTKWDCFLKDLKM